MSRSFYIEDELWIQVDRLVKAGYAKNISQFVKEAVKMAVVSYMKDERFLTVADYERLKRRHILLANECRVLFRQIKRRGEIYDKLYALAQNCGLEFTSYSNLGEVVPKMVEKWDEAKEHLHLFITLLELVKEKVEVEAKLEAYRRDFSIGRNR